MSFRNGVVRRGRPAVALGAAALLAAAIAIGLGSHPAVAATKAAKAAAATTAKAKPKTKPKAPALIVPTPAQARLKTPTTITQLLVPYFGLEHIAAARGFFTKYNLKVNFVPTLQGVAGLAALISGQAQTLQGFTPFSTLIALNSGSQIEYVVAGEENAKSYDVARYSVLSSSGITTPQQMIGKTLGTPAATSYYTLPFDLWLEKGGVDPSQVHVEAIPTPSLAQALESGQVQMVVQNDVYYTDMFRTQGSKVTRVFGDDDEIPAANKFVTGYVFTNTYVNAHPNVIRAYVAAILSAYQYVQKNPNGARQAISVITGEPLNDIPIPGYPAGLCINQKAAESYQPIVSKLGFISATTGANPTTWTTNKFNPNCTAAGFSK